MTKTTLTPLTQKTRGTPGNQLTTLAASLGLALGSVGCLPSAFDKFETEATAESQEQPAGANGRSAQFPIEVIGIEASMPPQGDNPVAMRFVAAGAEPPTLSTMEYLLDGTFQATSLDIASFVGTNPISMAAVGGEAGGVNGLIALRGVSGNIEIFEAGSGTDGPTHRKTLEASTCGGSYSNAGEHMFFAQTNVLDTNSEDGDGFDLIVTDGANLIMFADVDARDAAPAPECHACNLDGYLGTTWAVNGVSAIELTRVDDEQAMIVLGLKDLEPSGAEEHGRFEMFAGDVIRADNFGRCFSATTQLGFDFAEGDIGSSIAVGDFDGNGATGVALSSPDEDVIWILGDVSEGSPSGPPREVALGGSVNLGTSLAAGDIDGEQTVDDDVDELLVADFQSSAEGVNGAGVVRVLDIRDPDTIRELRTLHDSSPEDGQAFGRSLTISEFLVDDANDESDDLVIVGARSEVFTFFAIENATDPRR